MHLHILNWIWGVRVRKFKHSALCAISRGRHRLKHSNSARHLVHCSPKIAMCGGLMSPLCPRLSKQVHHHKERTVFLDVRELYKKNIYSTVGATKTMHLRMNCELFTISQVQLRTRFFFFDIRLSVNATPCVFRKRNDFKIEHYVITLACFVSDNCAVFLRDSNVWFVSCRFVTHFKYIMHTKL